MKEEKNQSKSTRRNFNLKVSFLSSTIAAVSWSPPCLLVQRSLVFLQLFWFTLACSSSSVWEDSCIHPASRAAASCQTWPKSHMQWSELNSGKCAGNAQLSSKFLIKALTQSSQESLEDAHWCQDSLCFLTEGSGRLGRETIPRSKEMIRLKPTPPNSCGFCDAKPGSALFPTPLWNLYVGPKMSSYPFAALLALPGQFPFCQNSSRAQREAHKQDLNLLQQNASREKTMR